MPAVPEEVHEAELEGVKFTFLAGPMEVLGKKGKVTGLLCQRMELGEPDESGRRRPVPIKGDTFTVEADLIIDCSGFAPDFPFLPKQIALADLHRLIFDRNDPTLSFVGTARPVLGSIPALAEMQARYIAATYSGRVRMPHPIEQEMDGFYAARQHRKRFLGSNMRPNLVDHEVYAADIARDTGVTVPWIRILFRSRRQFKMLLLAPWMAFKYELRGDHSVRAMAHINEHMPQEQEYYQIIKKRFAKPLKIMWIIQAVNLALILTFVPSYLLVTLALGFVAQQLLRSRAARKARIV
jgi:hypothetical protein